MAADVITHDCRMGDVQDDQFRHALRAGERQVPGHPRAPIVPDQAAVPPAEGIQQAKHIPAQFFDAVGADLFRPVAQIVTALVGDHHPITRLCQRPDLFGPGIPELRKSMQEHDQRPIHRTGLNHVQADTVGMDKGFFERMVQSMPLR